jgi:hypothetical protein
MTWSYDNSLTTDRDKLRLKIGDTDTEDQLLQDETLDALLAVRANVTLAAIDAVKAILAQLAREIDRQALGLGGPRSQKTTHYQALLGDLRAEALRTGTGVFFGGGSKAQAEAIQADPDKPLTPFRIGQFDNPGS